MSYTKDIQYIGNCKYIDPEKQNANVMLNDCINIKKYGEEYVKSIKKIFKINNKPLDLVCGDEGDIIEGFVSGPPSGPGDKGPGESFIELNECPEGYVYCEKTQLCKRICNNCQIKELRNSLSEPCPEGYNYDGIDNIGNALCNRYINDIGYLKLLNIQNI